MRCCYCNKEVDINKAYKHYCCSKKCAEKLSIAQDNETIENDIVLCPYCNREQEDIASDLYYKANDSLIECDYCNKVFILNAETFTRFTANMTDEEVEKEYQRQKDEERRN